MPFGALFGALCSNGFFGHLFIRIVTRPELLQTQTCWMLGINYVVANLSQPDEQIYKVK